jgi:hypothetical protein
MDDDVDVLLKARVTVKVEGKEERYSALLIFALALNQLSLGVTNRVGRSSDESVLFDQLGPVLLNLRLATCKKVAGMQYQRVELTDKGHRLAALIRSMDVPRMLEEDVERLKTESAEDAAGAAFTP